LDADVVVITALASGGNGVGRLADGMAVFVPRTAPGDRVRLRAVVRRRRHAEAQIAEVVEAGDGRTLPPCAHFTADRCGGCQWQHISPAAQAAAKRRILGDALRRIGALDIADPELVASPRVLGYRSTITLTVRWRGAHPVVGFHDGADPDRVFALDSCAIARAELNALWAAIAPAASALPKGDDVRLKLRVGPDGSRHVMVDGGEGAWTAGERLAQAAAVAGIPATVWWQPPGGATRRVAGGAADPAAVAFEQVNAEVAALLRAAVVEAALRPATDGGEDGQADAAHAGGPGSRPARRVLDLYAGAGETALPLAQRGCDVALVELDARAVRRAVERAAAAGAALHCIVGRVEDHLAALLPADVVIVNPPRTGLSDRVTARLREGAVTRLIYVSCDPATLARDLKRLGVAASRIVELRAFDMFPQTSHVETLAVVELGRTGGSDERPSGRPAVA
jgi:23S rRNA (uracil1939-C5)-methyltransferase